MWSCTFCCERVGLFLSVGHRLLAGLLAVFKMFVEAGESLFFIIAHRTCWIISMMWFLILHQCNITFTRVESHITCMWLRMHILAWSYHANSQSWTVWLLVASVISFECFSIFSQSKYSLPLNCFTYDHVTNQKAGLPVPALDRSWNHWLAPLETS